MPTDPSILDVSLTIFKWLGATSLVGVLGLFSAWLAFPPELVIEGVVDKSKAFNSESKMKIKNTGRLPALSVSADVENLCAQIGGITMKDCGFFGGPNLISRLSHGETSEISVRPGVGMDQGMRISAFSYTLSLKYHAKLFFLKKNFAKKWKVQLRNFQDGYSWDIAIV